MSPVRSLHPTPAWRGRRRAGAWTACAMIAAACATTPPAEPGAPPGLELADSVDHVEALAREPMVVALRDGSLFVTGYWDSIPPVWKSRDNGRSWSKLAVGSAADGAAGNSDSDLAVGPDGTLYLITLLFDRVAYQGVGIQVGVSRDTGDTWTWSRLSRTPNDDRPWIEVAPDGTAHAIWNDGAGVSHAVSTDTGRTWIEKSRVHDQGGSSHLAVGPNGELAVRVVALSAAGNVYHPGVDLVAVSTDRGDTWTKHAAPGGIPFPMLWDTTVTPRTLANPEQPRWVEPLAWDGTGALYSFWALDRDLWLGRSRDQGATWTTWKIATMDSTPYFPYLIARDDGEVAASWFSGRGDSLRVNAARLRVGSGDEPPTVELVPSFLPESFTMPGRGGPGRDTAGEYIPLVFLADGSLGLVAPIQDFTAQRLGFSWRRYVGGSLR